MKTQSTFSLTCTLLTLLCALASLPLNSWSKTGEQENWFLAKEVPLPTGFSPKQYWSDGTNEALLGWSGNKIHKLDFSSKALTFSSSPAILNVDFIGDPNLSTKPNGDLLILAGIGQFYLGKWNGPGSPNPGTFSYFTISEPASPTVKINGDEIPGVLIGGSQITANQSKIAILLGTDMTQYTGENITGIEGDYLIKIFEGNYTDYMGITQQNYFWLKNGNLPEQINGTINNIALTDENQLVVLTTGLAQYFTLQGQFIKKVTISPLDMGRVDYSSQNSQFLINSQKSPPGAYVYDKQGNFVQFLEDLKGSRSWNVDSGRAYHGDYHLKTTTLEARLSNQRFVLTAKCFFGTTKCNRFVAEPCRHNTYNPSKRRTKKAIWDQTTACSFHLASGYHLSYRCSCYSQWKYILSPEGHSLSQCDPATCGSLRGPASRHQYSRYRLRNSRFR